MRIGAAAAVVCKIFKWHWARIYAHDGTVYDRKLTDITVKNFAWRYHMFTEDNSVVGPQKKPPPEEIMLRTAWADLYAGRNMDTDPVRWCRDLRLSMASITDGGSIHHEGKGAASH